MNNYIDTYPDFLALRNWFEKNGYDVTSKEEEDCTFVLVKGRGVYGAFCTFSDTVHPYLNGRFVADNKECFNKWSQCPMVLTIPTDFDQLKFHLNFLGSKEGFEWSNNFDYVDDRKLPFQVGD
jgi:hypothetical protein